MLTFILLFSDGGVEKIKLQVKQWKKRESDAREKHQLNKNGGIRFITPDDVDDSEIEVLDPSDKKSKTNSAMSNGALSSSTMTPSPLAGLINIAQALTKMVGNEVEQEVGLLHKKSLRDQEIKHKEEVHSLRLREKELELKEREQKLKERDADSERNTMMLALMQAFLKSQEQK